MELQALLVLCGVGVAGVAVVLLMSLFSASGTSYEEAIAQQRKAATELLALADGKSKPKKSNKKANKKLAKKEKNREALAATGSEVEESEAHAESGVEDDPAPGPKPHVEFSPTVEVDEPVDTPPNVKIRKRGKDPKVKPILVNKEDPSCVSDPATITEATISNHFEEMHPKDEFELLHSASVSVDKEEANAGDAKKAKAGKSAKGKGNKQSPAKEEPAKEEPPREQRASSEAPKEQRKGKKAEKVISKESVEATREEVVRPLNASQPSELTTPKLLKNLTAPAPAPTPTPAPAPASSPPTKNKKKKHDNLGPASLMAGDGGYTISELVHAVREAVLTADELQTLTDALLNKTHDPKKGVWTKVPSQAANNDPMQKLKNQLAEKEKAVVELNNTVKELRSTVLDLESRVSGAGACAAAAEAGAAAARADLHKHQARIKRLIEDNQALAQDKLLLQSKLGVEGEAQARIMDMEVHMQRLSESEGSLVQQVGALQNELQARMVDLSQTHCELAASRDAAMRSQQHASELMQQLQEANHALGELEQQRQCAEQRAHQEVAQAQDRINALAELQNEVQRLTSRAQTAENALDKLKEEAEQQKLLNEELETEKQKLLSEVSSLNEQSVARETELAELRQLKAAPAQNGLPPAPDHLKMAKVENLVEQLRGELAAAHHSSLEQREQLARVQEQLVAYQHKNNELRTKNWKVMEALQSAEKALQTKSGSALPAQDSLREAAAKAQESHFAEVAATLRAACPAAAPDAAPGEQWIHTFAQNLTQIQNRRDEDNKQQDDKDLRTENEYLQSLVDKYKKVINETEGVLSRLQANVTTEEGRWAQQLADKQRELDDLRLRTVAQMQTKIDSLESELQQARSSHSHSFAESERRAEERVLTEDLTDKHNSSNGPLQVGLEEK